MSDAPDPFSGSSVPGLSFKDAPVGTSFTGVITKVEPELVQTRDFESGDLAFWPGKDGQQGNPKVAAVIHIEVDGEERSVWATKPSALFAAFGEARTRNGGPLEVGGTVRITYTGDKPNATNPRLNPAKQYTVDYKAPVAGPVDPWAPAATEPSTSAGQPWADAGPATGAGTAAPSGPSPEALAAARALLAEANA